MKILIYATRGNINSLNSLLQSQLPEAGVCAMENVENILAMTPGDCEDIDIAFVDASLTDAESAYRHMRQMCVIPVVMLIENDEVDWEKLSGMGLYGYLCLTHDKDIIAQAFKAILRRLPGYKEPAEAI